MFNNPLFTSAEGSFSGEKHLLKEPTLMNVLLNNHPEVITRQPLTGTRGRPTSNGRAACSSTLTLNNISPCLEYLSQIDELFIKRKLEIWEVLTGCELLHNRYYVKNSMGQKIYQAVEEYGCEKYCIGTLRQLTLRIYDNNNETQIILNSKPCASTDECCFPCCLQKMQVTTLPGVPIGCIEQEWSFWIPKFLIKNKDGEIVLRIVGPCSTTMCCDNVDFKILSQNGLTQVGTITKYFNGICKACTQADNFRIAFPIYLDVNIKTVLLGACFLIDFIYYANKSKITTM